MQTVYLTRRNLLTLLSKLERRRAGEETTGTIVKHDTSHPTFPCSDHIRVIAVEDVDYYTDRPAGDVLPADDPSGTRF